MREHCNIWGTEALVDCPMSAFCPRPLIHFVRGAEGMNTVG
ncbi:MAG: hypothetical protein AVDCRST_MAG67-3307 [uncultured Solirubrobacteraceae bacterium]|uniref:Uncharacterized protein n=1 Tax=uncultured Solirubrobacteraceae bacterium TaxID=1162706 RepID=A0A6J4TD67_9ACTN|nr:MAG: hypothetical protein AVDCRST_MAG67-3307 [uncultured Solirubrobacteraceae bacterium]